MKTYPIMYKHPTTGLIVEHEGMELRDWFAGIALPECIGWGEPEKVCARAYIYADEMMKARLGKATFDGETGELKSEVLSRGQE